LLDEYYDYFNRPSFIVTDPIQIPHSYTRKEDIEISVAQDGVEVSGAAGWKYSEKEQDYICKERACKSFYRYVDLPEEIKVEDVEAKICDGVLEVKLPKKQPKKKRKVSVK